MSPDYYFPKILKTYLDSTLEKYLEFSFPIPWRMESRMRLWLPTSSETIMFVSLDSLMDQDAMHTMVLVVFTRSMQSTSGSAFYKALRR
jgi:hypothetical protein